MFCFKEMDTVSSTKDNTVVSTQVKTLTRDNLLIYTASHSRRNRNKKQKKGTTHLIIVQTYENKLLLLLLLLLLKKTNVAPILQPFTSTEEKSAPFFDVSSNISLVNISVSYIMLYCIA